MRIQNVTISGYKSIAHTGITFSIDNIAAFIGKNSAGKSNILEALDCFFNNRTLSADSFYQNQVDIPIEITIDFLLDKEIPSFQSLVLSNSNIVRIKKTFVCNAKPQGVILGYWKYLNDDPYHPQTKPTAAILRRHLADAEVMAFFNQHFPERDISTPDLYLSVLQEYWTRHFDDMPKNWDSDFETPLKDFSLSLPSYYYLPVTYTVEDETKLGKNSRFQTIYNHILGDIDELLNDAHTKAIEKKIEQLYKKSGIEKRRKEVNKILGTIDNTHSGTSMHLVFDPIDFSVLSQRSTTVMIDDGYDSTVSSKGHGVQRDSIFRLLRAYLQLKSAADNKANFILAIDEPELYMHPTYKRALYSTFVDLSNNGFQIIYTTHDPSFVSVARFDDIHIVRKTSQHTSVTSCTLSTIKKTIVFNKHYRNKSDSAIRTELQHKCHGEQNEGFFADKIIIVEGATEQYALPIYFKKAGLNLDDANIAIVTADSVTLIAQLCTIFSAFSIPCFCIFDGDKPNENDYADFHKYLAGHLGKLTKKETNYFTGISHRLTQNKELVQCIAGSEILDFQPVTIEDNYVMWEQNFEKDVHEKVPGFRELRSQIIRTDGISKDSKPLIAAAIAEHYSSRLPRHIQGIIKSIIEKIKTANCIELRFIESLPSIVIHSESSFGFLPVYSCAAGRKTIVEADTAIGYAEGDFSADTKFLLHIQGDSMEPTILDGTYVAVTNCTTPSPGDYIVCMIDGGEMVCKKYISYIQNGQTIIKLQSLNKSRPDIFLTEDINVSIRGKVMCIRKEPICYQTE